jgi:hypothetical protein
MPTLRAIVDGKTLETVRAASPAAQHVAKNIHDPFGETKDGMDDLNDARMKYEVQKQKMRMNLAPVEKVVQGIKNMHQLDGPGDGSPLDMSPNNPNNIAQNQPPPMVDENGMVMGQPNLGQMTAPQGGINAPNAPGAQINESTGVPDNMEQTPGAKMNSNRPSVAGFQPGVSPGPAQSVRPGKMGTPQAGQGNASTVAGNPNPKNMPAGWTKPGSGGTGNQPGAYNKAAAPPKGNRSMPGAKGPGDPKVANRTKKAQANSNGGSGRPIHVEVRADSMMTKNASSTVARAAASDALRMPMKASKICPKCGHVHAKGMKACNYMKAGSSMEAREFSEGRRKKLAKSGAAMPGGGFPIVNREDLANAKQAIGRAKNHAAARRHINERAKALGAKPIGQAMTARIANLTQ